MAKDGSIRRIVKVFFDAVAAGKMEAQLEASLAKAGEQGGKAFLRELREEFDKKTSDLREKLARGLIDEKEFKRQSDRAARAFNDGLLKSMDQARRKGELTDREYVKLTRTLKRVGDEGARSSGLLATGFAKVIGIIGSVVAVRALARWTADVISLGVAGAETASKYTTTFGAATGSVDKFIDSFASLAGLSKTEAREFVATTGAMARGMGYTEAAAADLAIQVAKVAADLTSFNNVPIEQTSRAVRSALTGEREALKTLGIVVMEADVQQRAMALSGKANADALTQQEKAAATLALIQERMGPAAGDLVRTQDSMANVGRRVAAQWRTIKEEIGSALIEAESGPSVLGNVSASLSDLHGWLVDNKVAIGEFADGIVTLITQLGKLTVALAKPFVFVYRILRVDPGGRFEAGKEGLRALAEGATREEAGNIVRRTLSGEGEPGGNLPNIPGLDPAVSAALLGQSRVPGAGPPTPEEIERAKKAAEEARRARERAFDAEIAALAAVAKARELTANEIGRAIALEKQLTAEIERGIASTERRAQQIGRRDTLRGITSQFGVERGIIERPGTEGGMQLAPPFDPKSFQPIVNESAQAAADFVDPWTKGLIFLEGQINNIAGAFGDLAFAWAEGGIAGLAKLAASKVKENLARAIEMAAIAFGYLATGNPTAATLAGKSAAGAAAAAVAWGALGAVGGGGASAPTGSSFPSVGATNTRGASEANRGAEVHIHLVGPGFKATNPEVQRVVYGAVQEAQKTYGPNTNVRIHRDGS